VIHLLDANVLIARIDPAHPHHPAASRFFPTIQRTGWATCPLVENAFLRTFGRPDYRAGPGSPELARRLLCHYRSAPGHRFLPDDLSPCDIPRFPSLSSPLALTDLYLLGLAAKHGGRLATFDSGLDVSLIPGGAAAYLVIPSD
jgi:uncharacterized protein